MAELQQVRFPLMLVQAAVEVALPQVLAPAELTVWEEPLSAAWASGLVKAALDLPPVLVSVTTTVSEVSPQAAFGLGLVRPLVILPAVLVPARTTVLELGLVPQSVDLPPVLVPATTTVLELVLELALAHQSVIPPALAAMSAKAQGPAMAALSI